MRKQACYNRMIKLCLSFFIHVVVAVTSVVVVVVVDVVVVVVNKD